MCYEARKVPGGRTDIQIHSANWPHQLLGCIAPGKDLTKLQGEMGVSNSKTTVAKLADTTGKKSFKLRIRWAKGVLYAKSRADTRRRRDGLR